MNKSQKRVKAAERRAEKHKSEEYKEHLTNWYMLNLSWGILGIILLVFYGSLYKHVIVGIDRTFCGWRNRTFCARKDGCYQKSKPCVSLWNIYVGMCRRCTLVRSV